MTFYGAKKLKFGSTAMDTLMSRFCQPHGSHQYFQLLPATWQPSTTSKGSTPQQNDSALSFNLCSRRHLSSSIFFKKKKFKELRPERVRLRFARSIRFFVQNEFWSLKNYFKKRFWLIRQDRTVRFEFQNHISIILIRYTILWARRLLSFFLSLFFVSSSSF